MGTALPKLTVWYNTKCLVCDAGINWQKNRLAQAVKAGEIEFRDINVEPDALSSFGATIEDIRRRLYGLDSGGRLFIGANCAIEIWRRTPGDRWLASLLGLPVMRQLSSFAYDRFASLLYAWNRRKGHW